MSSEIIALGAVSALGTGAQAFHSGRVGERSASAVRHDHELAAAGLRKPFAARVSAPLPAAADVDRAGSLLLMAARELVTSLDETLPSWRARRVGLAVGTSGGGMPSLVRCVETLDAGQLLPAELARRAPYFGPLSVLEGVLDCELEPRTQLLAACASSVFALGLAHRWLQLSLADMVIAGGYDALCPFIAAGFECLGATAARPAPFRRRREGLALGEGAALVALVRAEGSTLAPRGRISGFAAASDAVHVTAPDRAGAGLARAAGAALMDADCPAASIDLVSAHGTGTTYNDSAESIALRTTLGEAASRAVVQPFKAVIGHTLGAAGVLETLAAIDAMDRGVLPAAVGDGEHELELTARLLDEAEPGSPLRCLKLSSAFGGGNAALVAESCHVPRTAGIAKLARRVSVVAVGEPVTVATPESLRGLVATDPVKLARMDPLSLLAVSALSVLPRVGSLGESTGVVVGSAAATLEIDAQFERRRRSRGPEPRRFPATSPNLAPGECTIAFGWHGPSHSVGAGPSAALEALLVAHDWVASGDADTVAVVAVEQVADFVRAIWTRAGWPVPSSGAVAAVLAVSPTLPELPRAALVEAKKVADGAHGALPEAAPGWPAFLAALARATR